VSRAAGAHPETILLAATPQQWVEDAAGHWQELLQDHANCEKKAASTALALIFAYPQDRPLVLALSRLAREELRHFEQVVRLMDALGVQFTRQRPGRYAQSLRGALRTGDPERKLDLLLMSALIEARSAERFTLLAGLYEQLSLCEARHHELYVDLARERAAQQWRQRLAQLAAHEAQLAISPDRSLRFHSGPLERVHHS